MITLGTLLIFIGGLVALNFCADPLLLYARKNAGSEAMSRVDQFPNMRLYKPLHVARIKPPVVIAGSSRSGTLNPGSIASEQSLSYNFSLPGITLFELQSAIQHAHAAQPLEELVIALDFDAFTSSSPQYRPGFDTRRMLAEKDDLDSLAHWMQGLRDVQSTLLSPHILSESLTILTGSGPDNRVYYPDGSWRVTSTLLTGRGGYRYVARNLAHAARSADYNRDLLLATYQDLLGFCYKKGIETTLFLTPVHASFVDLWHHLAPEGYWRDIHHRIVAINAELARRHGQTPFPILGFGHLESVVDEPIYLTKDVDKAWFNDGVHYRPRLARIIERSLTSETPESGVRLTEKNIGDYLDQIDTLRCRYVGENAKAMRNLRKRAGIPADPPDSRGCAYALQ